MNEANQYYIAIDALLATRKQKYVQQQYIQGQEQQQLTDGGTAAVVYTVRLFVSCSIIQQQSMQGMPDRKNIYMYICMTEHVYITRIYISFNVAPSGPLLFSLFRLCGVRTIPLHAGLYLFFFLSLLLAGARFSLQLPSLISSLTAVG